MSWSESLFSHGMDQMVGRPFEEFQVWMSEILTPNRIEGFLYVATAVNLLNALLVMGILAQFFRDDWLIPLIGGAMYLVNPCDDLRFYIIWGANCYTISLFFCLLASWLFLESRARGSRIMLIGACATLLVSGLSHEALLPMECAAPGLLWLAKRGRPQLMVWAYAWYATIALVSIRFITHLLFDHSYQLGMLGAADTSVQALWNDFAIHLRPLRQYYRAAHLAWRPFWIEGVIALTFFCVASAVASSRRLAGSQPRKTWIGVLIAFAVWQLGLLPFSFMPHNYRTQFFAAPGVAALFACLIGCAVANLRGRIRTLIGVSLAAWMVTVTTVAAWTTQQRSRRENAASFEKVIDVCDQVRSLSPRFVPGTLCVFLVNADAESPLGEGAAMEYISRNEFHGAFGVQATVVDPPAPGQPLPNPGTVSFAPDGVRIRPRTGDKRIELYSYDKLVLYRLGWEGAVSLLEKVPNSLLPHGQEGLAYAPLARMLPGPIPSTRFYQYPAWSLPPEDIVDYRSGVFLADRWGELQYSEGKLSRWAGDDAEILINPAGLTLRTLKFVLNSENESPPGVLEAVNDAGEVVATASDENVGGNNRESKSPSR